MFRNVHRSQPQPHVALIVLLLALGRPAMAAAQAAPASPSEGYDAQFARYLASARVPLTAPNAWMTSLFSDVVARRVNDLITIRVVESVSASGSADSAVNKASSADAAFPIVIQGLAKLVPSKTETKFAGSGSTTRASQITAVMTARVAEVLPNGDLVVEGTREIGVNGDQQLVVLTGVVRALDIEPGNTVSSTAIGQLRIRCTSRGVIKDSLTPGWLIRALQKVF